MFGEQKLAVTFGPAQDVLLGIAVVLVIFVLGAAAVNMIIAEVKSWFRKDDEVAESSKAKILYEVEWGSTVQFDEFQTRLTEDVEKATVTLLRENGGEGYIRYRPYVAGDEFEWGTPTFRDNASLMNPIYENALEAMRNYKPMRDEPTWPKLSDFAQDEESERTTYIIEWSNNKDFALGQGDVTAHFLTQHPETKVEEIIDELGPGYIRYQLSNDTLGWIPNGYVTKEIINAKTD